MRIAYTTKNFRPKTLSVIEQANAICREYAAQGFDLTLRQLYYQFVARGLIPNKQTEYNNLGSIVNDARMAGLMDWDFIVDRTRELEYRTSYGEPGDVVRAASRAYHRDLWADQQLRVEVWIEKDALTGVIAPTCRSLDVAYFSCRGYSSQSEMWAAGQRLSEYIDKGQRVVILHLGDHDPSGLDMTRDIAERLDTFTVQNYMDKHGSDFGGSATTGKIRQGMAERCGLTDSDSEFGIFAPKRGDNGALVIKRIALTMDQVDEYRPPPNPAKVTDSRFEGYEREYGDESWELDALDPNVLATLIEDEVELLIDRERFDAALAEEEQEREILTEAADRWTDVVEMLIEA